MDLSENELAIRWQDFRDQDAATALWQSCEPMVRMFATKIKWLDDVDEMMGVLHEGFVESLSKWDRVRGQKFTSFLYMVLNREVWRITQTRFTRKRTLKDGELLNLVRLDAPYPDSDGDRHETIEDGRPSVEALTDVNLIIDEISPDPKIREVLRRFADGEFNTIFDAAVAIGGLELRKRVLKATESSKCKFYRDATGLGLKARRKVSNAVAVETGVYRTPGDKWQARKYGKHLGTYATPELAREAVLKATRPAELVKAQKTEAVAEPEPPEEWRVVSIAPDYEVSSLGRIRNATNLRVLKPWHTNGHSTQIMLVRGPGDNLKPSVGHLVAEAFLHPKSPRFFARHRDGDPTNCRASNLVVEYIHQIPEPSGSTHPSP